MLEIISDREMQLEDEVKRLREDIVDLMNFFDKYGDSSKEVKEFLVDIDKDNK